MQYSHSRVESYIQCTYKYKLKYLDKIKMLDNYEPTNAFIIGQALHTGIQFGVKNAIDWYYSQFPVISDEHVNEAIKLEINIKRMIEALPTGGQFEIEIDDPDFKGYIDYLVEVEPNVYDLYDFKYSNNINRYLESDQLHLYKFYFEKNNPLKKIRNLYFVFAPKSQLKQKNNEYIGEFRRRFIENLNSKPVEVKEVKFSYYKVIEYLTNVKKSLEETEFNKNQSKLCYFCEYRPICEECKFYEIKESDNMNLPSTQRREITKDVYKKLWIYGAPFSGKTTFMDKAPNPLNLNTDGNIKYVTMPVEPIKDYVRVEGRQTITTPAWEHFKDTISELEKQDNDFKTIVVDLLEDTYEYCRLYMYDKLGITHETDAGYGKGYDMISTEYLSTLKKLINLNYNIVFISHEDTTKDITKRSGDKITAIKPNIKEKLANKIAGMVDIVGRVVVEDDGSRTLNFKSDEVVFGGGRLNLSKTSIPLNWDKLCEIYDEQMGVEIVDEQERKDVEEENTTDSVQTDEPKSETGEEVIEPAKRKRKPRNEVVDEANAIMDSMEPTKRRRKSEE